MIRKTTDDPSKAPAGSVSLDVARRIHAVCRQFESDWRASHKAMLKSAAEECHEGPIEGSVAVSSSQLQTYLDGVAGPEQSLLMKELLSLELELRSTLLEEDPDEADYQAFSEHAPVIAEVFRQWRAEQLSETSGAAGISSPRLPSIEGYEILGVLGRGGMGVVYKARHLRLKRLVALKMILAGQHAGEQHLARFRAEAETVARLQHPNIVQIFDIGEQDGHPYLTFELIEGVTLAEFAHHEPLPPRTAAELVEALARAMDYAHQQGIVHRDLKPGNVLLVGNVAEQSSAIVSSSQTDGLGTSRAWPSSADSSLSSQHATASGVVPKITDFGLAKDLDSGTEYTSTGAVLGTAQYMSPEQATGQVRDIGPASDIYSLGAVLYMLLTGRAPIQGSSPIETVRMVIESEPIAPTQMQPLLPKDLETICLKCLRKQPGQRYATAEQLAQDLRHFLQGEPIVARPIGGIERAVKWIRRRPAVAALLLVTVLGVIGIMVKSQDAHYQKSVAEQRRVEADSQKVIALGREAEALREAAKAKKAQDFLVSIFEFSDSDRPGETVTAIQILRDAEQRIPQEFADEPALQAELLAAIQEIADRIESKLMVAMILNICGDVQRQSKKDTNQQLAPSMLLYSDDRLSLAAGAQVQLVFLSDLHKERIQGGSEVTVRRDGSQPPEAVIARDEDIWMTFVHLPAGTFYMGWDGKKKGVKTEIPEDFEIAAYVVTQAQWQAVMEANPSQFSRFGGKRQVVKDISDEELKLFPVEFVSRDDVMEFIKKLNELEQGRGWLYRLPTTAEWEYACRNGATTEEECSHHFYFDQPMNRLSSAEANIKGDYPYGGAPRGVTLGRPSRVGAYPPNKLGLYDMHGNVFQWCSDLEQADVVGHLRGGSYEQAAHGCFAGLPHRILRMAQHDSHGFRLVRVSVEQSEREP